MFKHNTNHHQNNLFSFKNQLTKQVQKDLELSEESFFYKTVFCNIVEEDFSILYSEKGSRPNSSINAMISSLILYEKNGWSYEELFKQIKFNLLVRTALGLKTLDKQPFSQATLFNFQNRLRDYYVKTGVNLLEQVFDNLTEKQMRLLKLKTDIQRSDSFVIASNIRNYGRLELLIEVLIRFYRVLSDKDRERFHRDFDCYVKQSSGQYVYKLKKRDITHEIEKVGQLYHMIYTEFLDSYGDTNIFKILERVYREHFSIVEEKVEVVPNKDLHSGILQSPDDLEATYRKKRGEGSRGQSVNMAETCNPDNQLNLITDVSVNPNNKDDSVVLNARIDRIKEKTPDLKEIHTDGAYGSESNDEKMEKLTIKHVQTAVRGREGKVPISIEQVSEDEYKVFCPYQIVTSQKTTTRHKAEMEIDICNDCPLSADCPTIPMKNTRTYYYTHADYLAKNRQQNIKSIPAERQKLRPNVEATVNEFTYNLPKCKLKVRGLFKSMMFAFNKAIGINFGRIYRYAMDNNNSGKNTIFAYIFLYFLNFLVIKSILGWIKIKNIVKSLLKLKIKGYKRLCNYS